MLDKGRQTARREQLESMSREELIREIERLEGDVVEPDCTVSMAMLDSLIRSAPFPVYFKDRHARFTMANRNFLELYGEESLDAVRGLRSEEAFPGPGAEYTGEDEYVLRTRKTFEREITLAGTPHMAVKFPVVDRDGRLIGLGGVEPNIAYLKALEDELIASKLEAEAANRAKSGFLAAMSHELRTPLNAVIGFAEIIRDSVIDDADPERISGYAGDIAESGRHLLTLINDILDISRLEAGTLSLDPEPLDMGAVAEEVVHLLSGRVREGVTLAVEGRETRTTIEADPTRLRQVLINLIDNALKFTPEGRVRVVLDRQDGWARCRVVDTGPGIPAEELSAIMRPFERGRGAGVRASEGAGLGLWLTKGLVESHGGCLDLDSRVGEGTTATVLIPSTVGDRAPDVQFIRE